MTPRNELTELRDLLAQFQEDLAEGQALAIGLIALHDHTHQAVREAELQLAAESESAQAYQRGLRDAYADIRARLDTLIVDQVVAVPVIDPADQAGPVGWTFEQAIEREG